MSTMTLPGREAPSTVKRIDVEANLLQDWIQERRDLRKQVQARIGATAAVVICGFFAVAKLNEMRIGIAASERPVQSRLNYLNQEYANVQPAAANGTSELEIAKTTELTKKYSDAFMGQMVSLLNNASTSMALSSLKQDVLGGEVKQTGQADAENYYTANEFIQRNNDPTKNTNAVLVSTSRSDVLANDGVSFQFVKKVKVNQ